MRDSKGRFLKGQTPWNKKHLTDEEKKITKENIRIYQEKYRLEHKEETKIYHKKRYTENKDIIDQQNKQWVRTHKEARATICARWQKNNPEQVTEYAKKHHRENREKARIQAIVRYSEAPKKAMMITLKKLEKYGSSLNLTGWQYGYRIDMWSRTIKKLSNRICQVCLAPSQISHHLIYKSTEPKLSFNINNGIALCENCHNEVHGFNLDLQKQSVDNVIGKIKQVM